MDGDSRDPRLVKKSRRQRTVSDSAASDDAKLQGKNRKRRRTTSEGTDRTRAPPGGDDGDEGEAKRLKIDRGNEEKTSEDLRMADEVLPDKETMEGSGPESSSESEQEPPPHNSPPHEPPPPHDSPVVKKVRISEEVKAKSPDQKRTRRSRKRNKKAKEPTKQEIPELRVISKSVDIVYTKLL